jgi:CheY-like chemotaxis protein
MELARSMSDQSKDQGVGAAPRALHILVVEDNSLAQALTLMQLDKLGHQAEGVTDGVEALEALQQQQYDVIFMDLNMPRLSGLETTRRIHQQWSEVKRPYIIALTANSHNGFQEQCLKAGMNDFLTKPATRQQLAQALQRIANGRRQKD